MIHSASTAIERRLAPRFHTSGVAEVALGTTLALVLVQDLSMTGCGVEIRSGDLDFPDKLGMGGVLHFLATPLDSHGTILPFVLRNVRSEGLRVIYGLEFRPLCPHQRGKLLALMEAMAQEEVLGAP